MKQRTDKLLAAMPGGFEAALVSTDVNRFYFLGFDSGDAGTVLILPDKTYFIIDSRYIEIAEAKPVACEDKHDTAAIEKIETPNIATIEDICNFLGDTPENSIKSVLMRADDELIMVLVRGDREVNDVKVMRVHPCVSEIEMAAASRCSPTKRWKRTACPRAPWVR